MKVVLTSMAAVALLATGTPALAAPATAAGKAPPGTAASAPGAERRVKEKFYNFEDMLIDGEYKKPNALLFTARDKVKFSRLLKLRRSFLPVILTSDRERALK